MWDGVVVLQRLEGGAIMAAALIGYAVLGMNWWVLGVCLLVPDLAALGYLINWRAGNMSYNLAHTLAFPLIVAALSLLVGSEFGMQIGLIWLAHIGMDRLVGYGLKQGNPFERQAAR
jgi:hypothetical protein